MTLEAVRSIEETRQAVRAARRAHHAVGFVPTMGALHGGHASLMRAARQDCGYVVVSIFVNPTQFGPNEDLSRYPRTWDADVQVCQAAGVNLIFAPTPEIMYPTGSQTIVEVAQLQQSLCGITRPTHFRGVATVVAKLFNIVQPDVAYFGQKDAQQARLLMQMVRDLDFPIRMVICPTAREPDGLAMSSRNRYLDAGQRRDAVVLHQTLKHLQDRITAGERDASRLRDEAVAMITCVKSARLDYVDIVSHDTLTPLARLHGQVLIALAVYFGTTRLIDNVALDVT